MALCNAADRVISDGVAVPSIHHNPVTAYATRCADIVDATTHILDGRGTAMVLQRYKSRLAGGTALEILSLATVAFCMTADNCEENALWQVWTRRDFNHRLINSRFNW